MLPINTADGNPWYAGFERQIFDAVAAHDPDFPRHVCWFLPRISFTPVEVENQSSPPTGICTIVFPGLDVNDTDPGWNYGYHFGAIGGVPMPPPPVPLMYRDDAQKIRVGRWADAETLLVGFYLARSHEQHASLARIIVNSGVSSMAEPAYLSAALTIFGNPRFTAVSQLTESWRDVEYQ